MAKLPSTLHETTPAPAQLPARSGSLITPEDVLFLDEVRRTRAFNLFIGLTAVGIALGLPFLGGDPVAKLLMLITCVIAIPFGFGCYWYLRNAELYTARLVKLVGHAYNLALLPAYYYFGPMSGVVALVPIGVFMFSIGHWVNAVRSLVVVFCGSHALLSMLFTVEILEYRSLVVPAHHSTVDSIFILSVTQGIFIAAYFLGRDMRRSSLEILARHDRVVRDVVQREALLQEAMIELDQARQNGVGRYSELVVGSFKLGPLLGRGGMGEVYEAVHITTDEPAAIKLLLPSSAIEARLVERFMRELEVAAALVSPHIVRVLEVPEPSSPLKYLAMERLRGQSLAEILRHQSTLPAPDTARMLREIGAGVHAAHRAGIVHRDLKPANVFAHRETAKRIVWKVLDFGVSKLSDSDGTLTGSRVVGTPGYMAPEQASDQLVDYRADLFALTTMVYRVLTGNPPFSGSDVATILYAIVHTMPVRPSLYCKLPIELEYVLAIGLAKEPDNRFADVPELVRAVEEGMAGRIDPDLRDRAEILLSEFPWRKE